MPTYKRPFDKGNLVVEFEIDFPVALTVEQITSLDAVLPRHQARASHSEEAEECVLIEESAAATSAAVDDDGNASTSRNVYESDDDDDDEEGHGHGGPGVQCAQQ
jgi:DnaJ family protein A protein 2